MIDTTGSNICQRVIQTAHWLSLYIRIVFCRCRLHICLLSSSLPLTMQRYCFFLTYASKLAKIFHFSHISISTQSVKDLFCRLFSPRQDLLSYLFILFFALSILSICPFRPFSHCRFVALTLLYNMLLLCDLLLFCLIQ